MLRPIDAATATTKRREMEVKRWSWDCAYGFVVRAESEREARELASKECGDEGPDSWTDSCFSSCEVISASDGDAEVLMTDFLAG